MSQEKNKKANPLKLRKFKRLIHSPAVAIVLEHKGSVFKTPYKIGNAYQGLCGFGLSVLLAVRFNRCLYSSKTTLLTFLF